MKKEDHTFLYGGVSNNAAFKKEKRQCIGCKNLIMKAKDAYNFTGMKPYTYYCRKCYFRKLDD